MMVYSSPAAITSARPSTPGQRERPSAATSKGVPRARAQEAAAMALETEKAPGMASLILAIIPFPTKAKVLPWMVERMLLAV